MLILFVNNVTADDSIPDSGEDLYYHDLDENTNNYEWKKASENKPNIDIKEITFIATDNIATFTLKVNGEIENSEYITYFISYTSNESNYMWTYTNGQIVGNATNEDSSIEDNEPEFSLSTSTITVMFNSTGQGYSNVNFYGYAFYSLEGKIDIGQSWVDYAPDSYFPYDIIEEDIVEEDPNDGSNDNETDSNVEDSDDTSSKTPGFELVPLIFAICAIFFIFRRRK